GQEREMVNDRIATIPSVGHTSLAVLALFRFGHDPKTSQYGPRIALAIEFVCSTIDSAFKQSAVTASLNWGTYLKTKLGPFADTFLAMLLLAECRGRMPDAASELRVRDILEKVVARMQRRQRDDGYFSTEGLAPVLTQGLATKALNRAR